MEEKVNVYLRVSMPDGSKWDVPALYLARVRAAWYAEHDTGETSGPEYDKVYQDEYDYTLSDDYEIVDWAANNTDWKDIEQFAQRVQDVPPPDYHKLYSSAEFSVRRNND